MKIKIALHKSYGSWGNLDYLRQFMDESKNFRMELARVLEELPCNYENLDSAGKDLEDGKVDYVKCSGYPFIFVWDKEFGCIIKLGVVEVDTDIPWKITDYDGCEGIDEFQGITIVDKETGESKW